MLLSLHAIPISSKPLNTRPKLLLLLLLLRGMSGRGSDAVEVAVDELVGAGGQGVGWLGLLLEDLGLAELGIIVDVVDQFDLLAASFLAVVVG